VASATGSCQLAIGFSATANWLTGDSSKNITPGAGIKDCAGSLGTAGQALTSTATALKWDGPYVPTCCYDALGAMVVACDVNCPYTIAPAVADRYTLVSCASCPGGVFWSSTLSILGETAVGAIGFYAGQTPPVGWLVADGAIVSRTGYAALFDVIGTTYGAGDGSTTFQLPDMRGMFARGWDAAGGTSRNCDPGRVFGSTQGCAIQSHCHAEALPQGIGACVAGSGSLIIGTAGGACCTGVNTAVTGGAETRPVNVALLPCIKYENTTAPLTPSSGIPCSCITGKGALLTGNAACTPQALPVGVKGSVLLTNTTCALGLEWAAPGTNGQVLMACSTCANGTLWQTGAVGPWINAGTIQSVGLGATTTAPTVGTTDANNVRYRQIGPKEWEVVYSFRRSVTTGAAAGSGDYLYTLPGAIQWDTTLPFQTAYNGDISGDLWIWPSRGVPSGNGSFATTTTASTKGLWIVPFNSTTFRVIVSNDDSTVIRPQGTGGTSYPYTVSTLAFNFTFQVTTP
jgi:microcystin-dependent protein